MARPAEALVTRFYAAICRCDLRLFRIKGPGRLFAVMRPV